MKKLLLFVCSLALLNVAFATERTCPSTQSIQSVGITGVLPSLLADKNGELIENGYAGIIEDNKFDTQNTWSFYVDADANNDQDALLKAKDAIKTLTLISGPTKKESIMCRPPYYICEYKDANGKVATAISRY